MSNAKIAGSRSFNSVESLLKKAAGGAVSNTELKELESALKQSKQATELLRNLGVGDASSFLKAAPDQQREMLKAAHQQRADAAGHKALASATRSLGFETAPKASPASDWAQRLQGDDRRWLNELATADSRIPAQLMGFATPEHRKALIALDAALHTMLREGAAIVADPGKGSWEGFRAASRQVSALSDDFQRKINADVAQAPRSAFTAGPGDPVVVRSHFEHMMTLLYRFHPR
jgi:hypothetical protein